MIDHRGRSYETRFRAGALRGSVGSAESPERVRSNHEALDAAGIKNIYYEAPGTAHAWQTWRKSLHEMAPLMVRD